MWTTFFFNISIISCSYAALIQKPLLVWPTEYRFTAENIDLTSDVVMNFEVWYSEMNNKARISFYDGVVQRYYSHIGKNMYGGTILMFHPETNEDNNGVIKCEKMDYFYGDQIDFLPELFEFTYEGVETHGHQEVLVYKIVGDDGPIKQDQTLYVINEECEGIPVQYKKYAFNSDTGYVTKNIIINYFHFTNNIDPDDLKADESNCTEFAYGFHETVDLLYPEVSSDVDVAFQKYKSHHNKEYFKHEHVFRKTLFQKRWKQVKNHNAKNLSYKMAVNKYADRTAEELRFMFGIKYSGPIRGTDPFPHSNTEVEEMIRLEEIPEEYDMREDGLVSPVKNQAQCGSCWAFATAASLEGAMARQNGGVVLDLSEQAIVDCSWNYKGHGCKGAEDIAAGLMSVKDLGVPIDAEYGGYRSQDGLCHVKNMTKLETISGFVAVTPNSENALKAAIYKYGPVVIGIGVTENMMLYSHGIFYDMKCSPRRMNHAVTIVGYGRQYGELYWIVKNSWGQDWGESGYILMAAKDNNCNVLTTPVYPLV